MTLNNEVIVNLMNTDFMGFKPFKKTIVAIAQKNYPWSLLVCFFWAFAPCVAQQQDIVKIHTNQSHYFAGDTIWSSCYVLQNDTFTTNLSIKLVQYVLISIDKKKIIEAKIKIINGKGWCYLPLDKKIKTGIYTLYAFLPFEKNEKKKAVCIPITIFNLVHYKSAENKVSTTESQWLKPLKANPITVEITKTSGQEWQGKLTNKFGDVVAARFSIAIIDSSLMPNPTTKDTIADVENFNAYHKQGKGLQIAGEVKFKGKVPAELNSLLLKDSANSSYLNYQILGNKYPKFSFFNLDMEGDKTLFLELKKNYNNPFDFQIQADSFAFSFVYTSMSNMDIEKLFFYKKLEDVFQNDKKLLQWTDSVKTSALILTTAAIRNIYDITKYSEFKTIKETMYEIMGIVKIRNKKDQLTIKIVDGDNKMFLEEEPLFIVDGIPSFNNKVLFELDPSEVKTIEILNPKNLEPAWRGLGTYGIIDVHTKAGYSPMSDSASENIKRFKFQGYSPTIPAIPYVSTAANNPDFRTTLYWNPNLKTDSNGRFNFSFLPNHNFSNYYLIIKGVNQDGKYFEVVKRMLSE